MRPTASPPCKVQGRTSVSKRGIMTTIHSYTGDNASRCPHKDASRPHLYPEHDPHQDRGAALAVALVLPILPASSMASPSTFHPDRLLMTPPFIAKKEVSVEPLRLPSRPPPRWLRCSEVHRIRSSPPTSWAARTPRSSTPPRPRSSAASQVLSWYDNECVRRSRSLTA